MVKRGGRYRRFAREIGSYSSCHKLGHIRVGIALEPEYSGSHSGNDGKRRFGGCSSQFGTCFGTKNEIRAVAGDHS